MLPYVIWSAQSEALGHGLLLRVSTKGYPCREDGMDDSDGVYLGCWVSLKLSAATTHIVGTVRHVGTAEFASGDWLGLVLVPECRKFAKNDGSVLGRQYFTLNEEEKEREMASKVPPGSSFGIFVRPQAARPLSTRELIALQDITPDTKINLLCTRIETSKRQLAELSEQLEVTQVERECLVSDTDSLRKQLDDLIIEHRALLSTLEERQSGGAGRGEDDLLMENKRLEHSLTLLRNDFQQKETEFIETIDSLREDFQTLESKIKSRSGTAVDDDKSSSEFSEYELIVERLTAENSDLLSKVDQMTLKIAELEHLVTLNKDLTACYEQTEKELNDVIAKMGKRISEAAEEISSYQNSLKEANERISSFENYLESSQQNATKYHGIYKKILSALNESSNAYNKFLLDKISKPEWKNTLQLINLLYRLKYSANIILQYCESGSDDYTKWHILRLKSELMLELVGYEKAHVFDKLLTNAENIITFIMHCVELNDENEDACLLLNMSMELPFDIPNSFLNEEGPFYNSIEPSLLFRELMVYFFSANQQCDSETCLQLKQSRAEHKGVKPKNIETFFADLQEGSFDNLDFAFVIIGEKPFWEIEKEQPQVSTSKSSDQTELELKVKILQSKLLDEKKIHNEIMQLERKRREHEKSESVLEEKLKEAKEKDELLNTQIDKLQKLLAKYGINHSESHTPNLTEEFDILEKSKLLNTIGKQRTLITKLVEHTSEHPDTFKLLEKKLPQPRGLHPPKLAPPIPSIFYRRIDKLFDICSLPISDSVHNHSFNHQKILEYLDTV